MVKLLIWLPLSLAATCYALPATEPKPLYFSMFHRLSPSLVALLCRSNPGPHLLTEKAIPIDHSNCSILLLVVIPCLCHLNNIITTSVNPSVLIDDAPGPKPRESMLQGLWLTYAFIRVATTNISGVLSHIFSYQTLELRR